MVHEEWLNEDECVMSVSSVDFWVKYLKYVEKNYPKIDEEVRRELK